MSKNIVEYVLLLKDKVSPSLKRIRGNIKKTDASVKRLDSSISGLGVGLAGLAVGYGAIKAIKIAGDFEQTGIAFETMLGSVERGQQVLKDLDNFAKKTPFSIKGVQDNAKLLLAVGIQADNLIPTMKSLGDVSAGLSVPLERLALNYGQVKSQGKLTGRELRDFAIAGVPLTAQLSKQLGVSTSAISKLVSAGSIGFPEVEKAFKDMSGEGGRFANLMDKQNKSFLGQVNEMTESIQILARSIGQALIPIIRPFVLILAKVVTLAQKNTFAVKLFTKILFLFLGVVALIVIGIKAWSIAQAILNTIMLLNPIGLIIAGIVLLIGIIAIVVTSIQGWGEQWLVFKKMFKISLEIIKNDFLMKWKIIQHGFITALDLMKIAWLKAKDVLGFGDGAENNSQIDALTQGIKDRTEEIKGLARKQISLAKKLKDSFEWKLSFGDESPVDKVKKLLAKGTGGVGDIITGPENGTASDTKVTSASPKVFNINIDKMVETFNVNTTNMKDAPNRVKEMIQSALLEALADIEIAR